jgi:hypothetical protein
MSHVSSGAVLTLVVPLALLVVVLALWAVSQRRTLHEETKSPTAPRDG